MIAVFVYVHVKSDQIDAFKAATVENASNSINESGVARFDFFQHSEDPSQFTLVEVYKTPDDPARHKETAHYQKWRETVEDMMAEPRRGVKYENIFPNDENFE